MLALRAMAIRYYRNRQELHDILDIRQLYALLRQRHRTLHSRLAVTEHLVANCITHALLICKKCRFQ